MPVLIVSLTYLLGSQRPVVLRVVWIAAAALVTSAVTVILLLTH